MCLYQKSMLNSFHYFLFINCWGFCCSGNWYNNIVQLNNYYCAPKGSNVPLPVHCMTDQLKQLLHLALDVIGLFKKKVMHQ